MSASSSFNLFFIFAFAVILLQCLYPTGAATCHPDDEAGLLAFKAGITEDPSGVLTSWKKGTDCCSSWLNVLCQDQNNTDRVSFLYINGQPEEGESFTLSGTISPSLAKLQHLDRLYITNVKNITGPFPDFVFRLPKLDAIGIGNNRLSGPLPTNLGGLRQLSVLSVEGNRFTGPIPSSLSKISRLIVLNLGGNLLTGTIPLEFANLKNMVFLTLSDNHLSGTIPDIFGSMSDLRALVLSGNRFSGELPPSIASLPPVLTFLEVARNNLTGKFPSYLPRFESLYKLDLSWNQFSGTVPKSLTKLTKVEHIDISHNFFTGPFPVLKNVQGIIRTLHLSYNQFHLGTIPQWVTSAPYINSLKVAKCGIKMNLNDWKPNQTSFFRAIDLSENQVSGSPVRLLKDNYLLMDFRASGNKLRFDMGNVSFSNTLEALDLSRNLVFGKVPAAVAGLRTLNLSQNHLCGKLPVTKFPASAFAGNDCLCGPPLASWLVNFCVTAGEAHKKAIEVAQQINEKGPIAIKMAKKAIDEGIETNMASGLEVEEMCYQKLLNTQDRLEGLAAFAEKRKPVYTGK